MQWGEGRGRRSLGAKLVGGGKEQRLSWRTEEKKPGPQGARELTWSLGGPGRGQEDGHGGKVSPCRGRDFRVVRWWEDSRSVSLVLWTLLELWGKFKNLAESGLRNGDTGPSELIQGQPSSFLPEGSLPVQCLLLYPLGLQLDWPHKCPTPTSNLVNS